jgi:hypothetical protein
LRPGPQKQGSASRVAVAQRAATEAPDQVRPVLEFDFAGRRESAPAQAPRTNESIKQAIIRWLDTQV